MSATWPDIHPENVERRMSRPDGDLESLEIDLLLEAIYQRYGFDFRSYARGSIRRRLWRRARAEDCSSLTGLMEQILHDPQVMERLLLDLSVNVTSMFRDPSFYVAFRERVVPILRTYPFIRIWNAGCSTGEETYSLAIILEECGLYERSRIYATDINEAVLNKASSGLVALHRMQTYTDNYIRSGGTQAFSDYYLAEGNTAIIRRSLKENIVFAQHNLVSDRSFNEFNMIVCRNVMIYFSRELQAQVHGLFHDSLVNFGMLAIGHKESLRFTGYEDAYEELIGKERIFRKVL